MMTVFVLASMVAGGAIGRAAAPSREQELLAVIRSETPEADKALAFKGLAVHGSPACVPDVAAYLGSKRLSSWARITLEAIPGEEASAALRAAAGPEGPLSGRLLVGVINSLGVRRDAAAVPLLTNRLGLADSEVAIAAAAALGKIGTAAAGQALSQALIAGKPDRDAIAEACVVCGERLAAAGDTASAVGLFDGVRASGVSEQRRAEATRGAILVRGRAGLPLLVELLRSPERRLFNMGLFTARELAAGTGRDADLAHEVDLAILKSLPGPSSDASGSRKALLIDLLADRNATDASAAVRLALLDATGDADEQTRLAAIRAIGRCGDASSAAGLLGLAAGAGPGTVSAVRQAVATMAADGVDEVILSRLSSGEASVMPLAVALVGDRRIFTAVDVVRPLADHTDPSLRAAAITALGSIVELKDLPVLVAKAATPQDDTAAAASAVALREAAVRMADRDGSAAAIAEAVASAGPRAGVLLETLGEVGGGTALASVAAAAASGDAALQDPATRVLGKWMTADAAPVLLDLAATDKAGPYRGRAFKGYLRIARQFVLPEAERADMCRKALAAARDFAEQKAAIDILVRYPHPATLAVAKEAAAFPEMAEAAHAAAAAIEAKLAKTAGGQ